MAPPATHLVDRERRANLGRHSRIIAPRRKRIKMRLSAQAARPAVLGAAQSATPGCYHFTMASRHPRLGVVRDPAVERALALTEPLLEPTETRSAAAQIRALTLRGAQAVLDGAGSASKLEAQLAERYGAKPGHGSLADLDRLPGEPNPDGTSPASDALRWVRGE